MAKPRMDLSAFVGKLLEEQDGDVLREGVRVLAQALMETRGDGAGRGRAPRAERRPDGATAMGPGSGRWDTRVGTVDLAIPKVRPGTYFPSLLQPRRRAEQALLTVVQEAYVHGVSTRKVDDLVKALGLDGISKSEVSRICARAGPGGRGVSDAAADGRASLRLAGRDVSQGADRRPGGEPGDGGGDRRDARRRAPGSGRRRRRVGGPGLLDGVSAEPGEARAARACAW